MCAGEAARNPAPGRRISEAWPGYSDFEGFASVFVALLESLVDAALLPSDALDDGVLLSPDSLDGVVLLLSEELDDGGVLLLSDDLDDDASAAASVFLSLA